MDPLIVTCALTGGMTVPAQSPHIPITAEEIIAEGVRAAKAGAAVLHVHVREETTGRPVSDIGLFTKVLKGLREQTDAVVQPTTGGGRGMTIEERAQVLALDPEMATLNVGSFNFGLFPVLKRELNFQSWEVDYLAGTEDYIFRNTFADVRYLSEIMTERRIFPEIEVYDIGHLDTIRFLLDEGILPQPFRLQFVLGVLGASSTDPDNLLFMLRAAERKLGKGSFTWSVAGVGYRGEFRLAAIAAALGGHIRVGLEDNLRVTKSSLAESNAELVERAVSLAHHLDREPVGADDARRLMGMPARVAT